MRRRLPPLKTLPAFEIAADRLSFSEAAGDLHLTHGAVSRQIKTLESALGVPLFRRRNRRIELTEAGLALLPGVRQALQLLEACAVQVATSPQQGALVVSCVATFMMRWPSRGSMTSMRCTGTSRSGCRRRMRRSISCATESTSPSGAASRRGRATC
jgi:LysR family glycine cleavage system transcriptional activator